MAARISRQHLSDASLDRAVSVLTAQLSALGALRHRYRTSPDITYEMDADDNAVCDVLGILLGEQRGRRLDDAEAALT
jgi:hypothetical protein